METGECASLDVTLLRARVGVHSLDRGLLEFTFGNLRRVLHRASTCCLPLSSDRSLRHVSSLATKDFEGDAKRPRYNARHGQPDQRFYGLLIAKPPKAAAHNSVKTFLFMSCSLVIVLPSSNAVYGRQRSGERSAYIDDSFIFNIELSSNPRMRRWFSCYTCPFP